MKKFTEERMIASPDTGHAPVQWSHTYHMPTHKLTAEILNAAIEGFESQKRRIDEQIAEIRQLMDGSRAESVGGSEPQKPQRRMMSVAARKRMAEAQRKRWAASKGESEKPKRKMSAAGRANIVAALKRRWAAKKAGSAASKKAAPKKAVVKKAAGKTAVAQ
jgi:hypothetical protein